MKIHTNHDKNTLDLDCPACIEGEDSAIIEEAKKEIEELNNL